MQRDEPVQTSLEWRGARRFFERDTAKSFKILMELPADAQDLKEVLSRPDIKLLYNRCLDQEQSTELLRSRTRSNVPIAFLMLAILLGSVLLVMLGRATTSPPFMALALSTAFLIIVITYFFCSLLLDRIRKRAAAAGAALEGEYSELLQTIVASASASVQVWIAAFLFARIELIECYGPLVNRRLASHLDLQVKNSATARLLERALVLTAIGLAGVSLLRPALTLAACALAITCLLLASYLGREEQLSNARWRHARLLTRVHDIRTEFELALNSTNLNRFLAVTSRALVDVFSSEPAFHDTTSTNPDDARGFRLIDYLDVPTEEGCRRIALYHGDISALPQEHAVDFLIISAWPNQYAPIPRTVIGSLADRGLTLNEIAANKEHDLRASCGFWISKDLSQSHPDLHARRLLCFEPLVIGDPPRVVGDLFRGMFPFLDFQRGSIVATSLIAAGAQHREPHQMFRPLIESAIQWFRRGLPVNELKIVIRSGALAERLKAELPAVRRAMNNAPIVSSPPPEFDVFISYSGLDAPGVQVLKRLLHEHDASLRVWDFKNALDVGKSYQVEIDASIERCSKVVALMSPSYFASPECQEELQMARLRNKRSDGAVLFPIYWKSLAEELRLWIQTLNYADCREADVGKLALAVRNLKRE